MPRPLAQILADIEQFRPDPSKDREWLRLDGYLNELFAHKRKKDLQRAIEPLLRLFERFPRHDGYGVLWSVIHGLERIGGYERALMESVKRAPTHFGATMLLRMVNGGAREIDGVDLPALARWVESACPPIDYTE